MWGDEDRNLRFLHGHDDWHSDGELVSEDETFGDTLRDTVLWRDTGRDTNDSNRETFRDTLRVTVVAGRDTGRNTIVSDRETFRDTIDTGRDTDVSNRETFRDTIVSYDIEMRRERYNYDDVNIRGDNRNMIFIENSNWRVS